MPSRTERHRGAVVQRLVEATARRERDRLEGPIEARHAPDRDTSRPAGRSRSTVADLGGPCSRGGRSSTRRGTLVRSLSITSWRWPHSLANACIIAAAGSARTAPTGPSSAAPASAAPNADRRMQLHRARRDARREEVVLDLLVDDDEAEHDRAPSAGESRNVDQHRQDAGEVRADHGQELADEADPERERDRARACRPTGTRSSGRTPTAGPAAHASRGSRRSW